MEAPAMMWWLLGSLGLTGGGIGIAALLGGGPFMLMAAKWLWSWLSHATFLQVVCVALALFGAVQTLRVWTEQRHAKKADAQLIKCSHRQQELEAQSKVQQHEVTKTVDHYLTVTKPVVRTIVQRIESAPLPGNCTTPDAVLGADV